MANIRVLCRGMVAPDDAVRNLRTRSKSGSSKKKLQNSAKLANLLNWHTSLEGELANCAVVIQAGQGREVLC